MTTTEKKPDQIERHTDDAIASLSMLYNELNIMYDRQYVLGMIDRLKEIRLKNKRKILRK